MDKIYEEFLSLLELEDKEGAVKYAINLLENKGVDIVELYTKILSKALNTMECKLEDKNICIWKEHIRTGIIRTIVELSYLHVLKKRDELSISNGKKAVILCPPEEYHDLGARMASDFFIIAGYDTIFVGSNTPYNDFYNAIHVIKPDIVAISVSNYYNLVSTKKIISDLKNVKKENCKILVGGYAFDKDISNVKKVGADYYTNSFEDILNIAKKG